MLAITLSSSAGILGCGGFAGVPLPETSINAAKTPIGTISGSDYGGHAPLAGAHIYLVEPGNTGYGSAVKSLITSSGSNVTQNGNWTNAPQSSDQFVPAGAYGILADANSGYTLTGDYTCDVGRPVWVIGYGGSPTFPANNPSVPMATSSSTSNLDTIQSDGTHALYNYTTASTENFYIGEAVTISGFGNGSAAYNISGTIADPGNTAQTVTYGGTTYSPVLTTTTFSIYTTAGVAAGAGYTVFSQSGQNPVPSATVTPVFNPAAVNVASLGVCPSKGTLAGSISYIYMNEVSTTAWAYAFNQFANWSVNDQSGNNEFNVGAPGTTQAQQALVNAAYAAENLYDIQGSNLSTSYAGEGHIARTQTPSGAGIVPQTELDTIANILAACVDSPNTYRAQAGTVSPQCNTLETYATDNGVYDSTTTILSATSSHVAFNIAQAAMNMAHYPQGAGTGTTSGGVQTVTAGTATSAANFVKALYTLPTGNVPFTPNLVSSGVGQPNDFSIGISWQTSPYATSGTAPSNPFNSSTTNTGSTTNLAQIGETAIDSLGNAWIMNNTPVARLMELTSTGYYTVYGPNYYDSGGTDNIAGLAIDTSNNVFVSATQGLMEYPASNYNKNYDSVGAIGYVSGGAIVTRNSAEVAVDNNGYLYVANLNQANPSGSNSGDQTSQLVKIAAVPGTQTAVFTVAGGGANNTASQCANSIGYVTLDQNNNIWTTSQAFSGTSPVCLFNSSGVFQYSYTGLQFPHMVAVDKAGNAWVGDKQQNTLNEFPVGITSASGVQGAAPNVYTAGSNNTGAISNPRAVAVDGANTIWITNGSSGSITQVSDTGVLLSPTFYTGSGFNVVSGQGAAATSATFLTIDPSGNLWASDTSHGQVVEWIGVAAPTVQPLAAQRAGTVAGNGHGTGQMP